MLSKINLVLNSKISHAFSDMWHLDFCLKQYQNVGLEQLCAQREGGTVMVKER